MESLKNKLRSEHRLKKINKDIKVLTTPPSGYDSFYSYEIRQQGEIEFKPEF